MFYRLNVIPLKISPLRERREDIPELVQHFAMRYASLFHKQIVSLTEDTMNRLCNYPWYGNVRELENSVEFMINMMDEDGILNWKTLPENILEYPEERKERNFGVQVSGVDMTNRDICPLKVLEEQEIRKALNVFGNGTEGKKQAAKALGISLATLYRKLGEN